MELLSSFAPSRSSNISRASRDNTPKYHSKKTKTDPKCFRYDEHLQRSFAARVALIANAGAGTATTAAAAAAAGEEAGAGVGRLAVVAGETVTFRASPLQQFVRALIHAATFGLAYVVMLLAMYYNGYIIISILLGALLGKFFCDWMTRTVVIAADGGVKVGGVPAAMGIEEASICCG